ncbi:MAG: HlyD family efflux transporter periplasmic adaptor subunit [Chlamydiota bacterium]|nr:HlyD family efflux transporter periplasmic adaptor subunit [Chlamydiota bacterium]
MSDQKEKFLPRFRKDLEFYPGPDDPDGSPTYNLFDPIKGQYYKIKWVQYLIFRNLTNDITLSVLLERINKKTTTKVTEEQISHFFNHAATLGLLAIPKSSDQMEKEAEMLKVHPLKWLLFNYLYFRVPLCNPDKFLDRTLPIAKLFVSRPMIVLYVVVFLLGTVQLLARFDEFINTFTYFFSLKGIIIFGLSMNCIKILHELGHAYTAKYYGVNVQKMGLVFLVLWPVMFTDVTDGWRLPKRRQRFAISIAGVAVELVIAGISTLCWAISSPGIFQSVFFIIASTTWISTLIVNLNPAMRFDGYYLLCDLWGVDNLQSRSFAMAQWKLRKMFLGLNVPPPENGLSKKRIRGMVLYSLYTWTYRVFLYTAIALFVYTYFTKVLGVFLFVLEVGVFLVWPIASELSQWKKMRRAFRINTRLLSTVFAVLLFLTWFVVPLPHTESFIAVTKVCNEQVLYIPYDGIVKKIYVDRDVPVAEGEKILQISSEELSSEIKQLLFQKDIIEQQIRIITFGENEKEDDKAYLPEKEAELAGTVERLKGLIALNEELTLKANFNGEVYDWDKELYVNQPVSKDQIIGKIADVTKMQVLAFIPEESIDTLKEGQEVSFVLLSSYQSYKGVVTQVIQNRTEFLNYPQIASTNGGDLPVTLDEEGKLQLVDSYYTAIVTLEDVEPGQFAFGERGYVEFTGPSRSKMVKVLHSFKNLLWRESGI